jgi:hypothetical protein
MRNQFTRAAKGGIFGFMLTVVLTGCATAPKTGPLFSPATGITSDKATLYIYRPEREFNYAGWPLVTVNNEEGVPLMNNGYFVTAVESGDVLIKADGSNFGTNWWPGPAMRSINVEAGKVYYVRLVPHLPPGVTPGPHLFWSDTAKTHIAVMPEQQALTEISSTYLIEK